MSVQSISLYAAGTTYLTLTYLPWGNYWVLPLKTLLHWGTTAITRPAGAKLFYRGGPARVNRLFNSIEKCLPGDARPSCGRRVVLALGAGEMRILMVPRVRRLAQPSHRWSSVRTWNESTPAHDQLGRLWPRNCVGSGLGIASVDRGRRLLHYEPVM